MNRIKWTESQAYVRATSTSRKLGIRSSLTLWFVSVLLISPLAVLSENPLTYTCFVVFGASLFIVVFVAYIAHFSGHSVCVNSRGVVVGSNVCDYRKIKYATVGTVIIESETYPIFSYILHDDTQFTFGLGRDTDPRLLWDLLSINGVNLV